LAALYTNKLKLGIYQLKRSFLRWPAWQRWFPVFSALTMPASLGIDVISNRWYTKLPFEPVI